MRRKMNVEHSHHSPLCPPEHGLRLVIATCDAKVDRWVIQQLLPLALPRFPCGCPTARLGRSLRPQIKAARRPSWALAESGVMAGNLFSIPPSFSVCETWQKGLQSQELLSAWADSLRL